MRHFWKNELSRISYLTAVLALVCVLGALVLCNSAQASLTAVYVAESQSGTGDGSSCQNADAVTFFNNRGNWGSGSTQIGAGSTIHLCGTITTQLLVQGSGASGNPITVQWESGASVQVCSTTGAVVPGSYSHLVFDLGANTNAVECPSNGTALGSQIIAVGFGDRTSTWSDVEIRNGGIGPIYQYSGTGADGVSSAAIRLTSGGNNHFHNLTMTHANQGILAILGGTTSNDEFDHITTSAIGQVIWYAIGNSGNISNASIHDFDITFGANWGVPGDYTHTEFIHLFTQNASNNNITNTLVYNNYVHGARPASGYTGDIFVDGSTGSGQGTMTGFVFNNLLVSSANGFPGDGAIYMDHQGNTFGVYNNTIDCGGNSAGLGMQLDSQSSSAYTVKNNIIMNCYTAVADAASYGGQNIFDYNDYYNVRSGSAFAVSTSGSARFLSFSQWQSLTGQDSASSTGNPGLNTDYTIASSSSLANTFAGSNLTTLNVAPLNFAKPTTVGILGTSSTTIRPSSGSWDLGAYAMGETSSGVAPNPPTGLQATVR